MAAVGLRDGFSVSELAAGRKEICAEPASQSGVGVLAAEFVDAASYSARRAYRTHGHAFFSDRSFESRTKAGHGQPRPL